jgi:hypothetical protein
MRYPIPGSPRDFTPYTLNQAVSVPEGQDREGLVFHRSVDRLHRLAARWQPKFKEQSPLADRLRGRQYPDM